jgi:hypothetical protein
MFMHPASTRVDTQTQRQCPRPAVEINTIAGSTELMGTRISYARNVEMFGEGEPAEYRYKVVTGSGAHLQSSRQSLGPDDRGGVAYQ